MGNRTLQFSDKHWQEFTLLYSRLEHLFVSIDIDCPYGLPHVATFHQATFAPLGEHAMELFLAAGFRRNGNCLYNMRCAACDACRPIRLHPHEFRPNRNQRRTLRKNGDLRVSIVPLRQNMECLLLCDKFLQARYPGENNTARGYYRDFFFNNIVNSAQIQYRLGGRLVGNAIVDIGYNWLNAVYFYFDPEESRRGLGTQNILYLVELCRQWEVERLYLGYVIDSISAMNYKKNFRPYYLFTGNRWQKF
jgi:arginyl-tRNA--protein-N-Asp/Glu arginylyltransferase